MRYDAFISYSHAADGRLAPALQLALKRFAKPWNKRRALHVFRDGTNLGIHPDLWGEIVEALGSSRYFVLLASPSGASSKWVGQEISFWRENRSEDLDKLLVVLTEGELKWIEDGNGGRLAGDAVHPQLADLFSTEPLYLDLRAARDDKDLSLANPEFSQNVARLSSEIRGIPLDDLIGEDVRQHKRTKLWVRGTMAVLATLVLAVSAAAWFAFDQRGEALAQQQIAEDNAEAESTQRGIAEEKSEEARLAAVAEAAQRRIAEDKGEEALLSAEAEKRQRAIAEGQTRLSVAQRLAVQGQLLVETTGPAEVATGSLLVIEALQRNRNTLQGHLAWSSVLDRYPPLMARHVYPEAGAPNAGIAAAISPDGRYLAVSTRDEGVLVLDAESGETLWAPGPLSPPAVSISLRPGAPVIATAEGNAVRLFDFAREEELARIELPDRPQALAFGAAGQTLAVGDSGGGLHVLGVSSVGQLSRGPVLRNASGDVMLPALNPQGRLLMANCWHTQIEENVVRFWDLESGAPAGPYAQGDTKALAFSPSGRLAAIGGFDDVVEVYAIEIPDSSSSQRADSVELQAECRGVSPKCQEEILRRPVSRVLRRRFDTGSNVTAVAIDPADELLAAATPGGVRIWNLQTGIERPGLDHADVGLVAWVDEGKRLATVSTTEVRIWNSSFGTELGERVRAHAGSLEEAGSSFESLREETCRRIGRNLTDAEWERYLGDDPRAALACG